jgi:hypothetical protein
MIVGLVGAIFLIGGGICLFLLMKLHSEERNTAANREDRVYYSTDIDNLPSFPLFLAGYIGIPVFMVIGLILFLIAIL